MNIGSSLSLEQKQQLRLNTRMLQSLQLMTLPIQDLQMTVNEALESNPVLVQSAPKGSPSFIETQAHTTEKVSASGYEASDKFSQWMENAVAEEETLQDHLMKQLGCVKTDAVTEGVARIIISNLDKNGFHSTPPALLLKTEAEKASLNKALSLVQSFDPEGVGVSDYKESLIVQAKALGIRGEEEKAFEGLVNNELEKMRAGKKAEVAKDLGIEPEDLDALFDFLKTLTPYPGLKYSSSPDVYIVPDLSIRRDGENLVMKLNSEAIPSLSVDSEYQEMAETLKEDRKRNKEAIAYLKDRIGEANDLIEQINLRNTTLEKVGLVLMERQGDFFRYGPQFIRPLILRDVAEIVGVHETTISRITTSKYIDTDYGIIPIKLLFSTAVSKTEGQDEGLSKNAVKDMVREIIEEHTGEKALSDQKISDLLAEKGIKLARRTVAKYRKELDIDSSFIRG